jgi:catechol 2,3-dioxygenase-like lactoylglutathione lyase family enzyme
MAKFTWDHVHFRTPDVEATAQWFEKMLGAEIKRSTQQGAPRVDMVIGGQNVFLAPVKDGDGVATPPKTPYQGLDHFGLTVTGIDAIAADLKARRRVHQGDTVRPACASASSAARKAYRSNCSTARSGRRGTPRHPCVIAGGQKTCMYSDARAVLLGALLDVMFVVGVADPPNWTAGTIKTASLPLGADHVPAE